MSYNIGNVNKKEQILLTAIIIALSTLPLFLGTFYYGIGIQVDTFAYFKMTESINDIGIFNFLISNYGHYPPGYPAALYTAHYLLDIDLNKSALLLNYIYILISSALLFAILKRKTQDYKLSFLFTVAFIFSLPNIIIHLNALSEAQFFAIILSIIYLYDFKSLGIRFIIGLLFVLLIITRYSGLGIFAGFVIHEIYVFRSNLAIAFKNILIVTLPSIVFFGFVILVKDSYSEAPRDLVLHSKALLKFLHLPKVVYQWIFYNKYHFAICLILLIPLIRKLNLSWKFFASATSKNKIYFFITAGYFILLFCSLLFFDGAIPIDTRLLGFTFAFLLIYIAQLVKELTRKNMTAILTAVSLVVLNILITGLISLKEFSVKGIGLVADYNQSVLLKHFNFEKNMNSIILTNRKEFFYFHNLDENSILSLTPKFITNTGLINQDFEKELKNQISLVHQGKAIIVYFYSKREYLANPSDFEKLLPENYTHNRYPDGIIYGSEAVLNLLH